MFVALYTLVRVIFYLPVKYLTEERIVADANEHSHFMESVRAIQTLKLFEKESEREAQWQNKFAESLNKHIKIRSWEFSFDGVNRILFGLENILVIYFAAVAVTESLLTVGMLFAFISYKSRFTGSMDNLILKAIEFRMLDIHFDRLADVVFHPKDNLVEKSLTSTKAKNQQLCGQLEIKDLGFSYNAGQEKLLKNISLEISAGDVIAITGQSGCGKTTLMKCMMGLLNKGHGSILFDDTPLEEITDFRKQIAAVMQDDQLLSGSILDNIGCFESKIDQERVFEAARMANVFDDIAKMPMQFNTFVGEMGISLSGGQKQRILLARALYKQPRILFMDEATCHLDTQNESHINSILASLKITRILIAHRPETIRHANRVFQLADGELNDITQQYKR